MVAKRRLLAFSGLVLLIILAGALYWFYFSKPGLFPKDEQLIMEINRLFPEAKAGTIQDTVQIDDKHIVVPFISKYDQYGVSYWVWEKHKWQTAYIDTRGQPHVWKIDRNDPSSYYFVWNIHPRHQLSNMKFYCIREREYHVTNGKELYKPRLQMEKNVMFEGKSYGVMHLPEKWGAAISSVMKVNAAKNPDIFFNQIPSEQQLYFGWIPYDQSGKEKFPEDGVASGNGFSSGSADIEYVMVLSEEDVE